MHIVRERESTCNGKVVVSERVMKESWVVAMTREERERESGGIGIWVWLERVTVKSGC